MSKYYRICLRHMGKNDNCFLLWGKGGAGYFRALEDCEVYDEIEPCHNFEKNRDDFDISKELIDQYKQKIVLPQYGDNKETYAGRNEFYVLPNTGQVRKALGITTLDIELEGDRNSFNAYFKDEIVEVFKTIHSKTHFQVKAKEHVPEFWYLDAEFEAESRNKAIHKAFGEWMPCDYDGYIDFKKDVTCKRVRTIVFDKWRKL